MERVVPKLYQLINLKWFLGYDKPLIEFQNLLSLGYQKEWILSIQYNITIEWILGF